MPKGRIFSILVGLFFLALLVMNHHIYALLLGKRAMENMAVTVPGPDCRR